MRVNVDLTRYRGVLHYLAKFLGLSPFTVKNNEIHPVTSLGKAHSLTLVALTFLWTWSYVRGEAEDIKTDVVFAIYIFLVGGSTVSGLYIFAFKSKKIIDLINRIVAAEYELEELGVKRNRAGNLNIVAINIFVLAMKIIVLANVPAAHSDKIWSIFLWVGVIALSLHNINLVLIFVQTMNRIGECFESLNENLWDILWPVCAVPSSSDLHGSSIFVVGKTIRIGYHDLTNVYLSSESLRKMRKLHHELSGLVISTIDFFTTPILLAVGHLFTSFLICCHSLCRYTISVESLPENTTTLGSILLNTMPTAAVSVLELMLIAHACSSTCNAGNAMEVKIHRVWNKFHPEVLRSELFIFSVQLLHNPVTATAFGFFDLGYSYLREMFYAVVAYLVIMIQLDKNPQ